MTDSAEHRERFGPLWTALDVGIAVLITALATAAAREVADTPGWFVPTVTVLIGPPLAVRHRWPVPVLVAMTAGLALYAVFPADPAASIVLFSVPPALLLYRITRLPDTGFGLAALLAFGGVALLVAVGYPLSGRWNNDAAGGFALWVAVACGAAIGLGRFVHDRWPLGPDQPLGSDRPASRPEAVDPVVVERARIADELRDLAAVRLSRIATATVDIAPDAARESRALLSELRELLVRLSGSPNDSWKSVLSPGVADLDAVVNRAHDAGVWVALTVTGPVDTLPTGTGTALYHVVQESVSNVIRHSPADHCEVRLSIDLDRVRVEVTDPGPVGRPGPDGDGIAGMRRRVDNLGGEFSAGPRGSGYTVSAVFPVTD